MKGLIYTFLLTLLVSFMFTTIVVTTSDSLVRADTAQTTQLETHPYGVQNRWNLDYIKSSNTVGMAILSRDRTGNGSPDDLLVIFWKEQMFQSGSCYLTTCEVMGNPYSKEDFQRWFDGRTLDIMNAIKKEKILENS